jgi:hypothetical protein
MKHLFHTCLLALRLVTAADYNTQATAEWLTAHDLLRSAQFDGVKRPQQMETFIEEERPNELT